MKLKVKTAKEVLMLDLDDSATMMLLKVVLEERVGLAMAKHGFPPSEVVADDQDTLMSLGVRSGDTLIVREIGKDVGAKQGTSKDVFVPMVEDKWLCVRRVVPGDNSCLFHAAAYVFENKSRTKGPEFRGKLAEVVAAYPQKYTTDYLDMPNAEYVRRIRDTNFWGGAIELSILSFLYSVEIHAFDAQTQREDRYGQAEKYSRMALVLFAGGNHYDVIAMTPYYGASESEDRVIFSSKDEKVLFRARKLVEEEFRKQFDRR